MTRARWERPKIRQISWICKIKTHIGIAWTLTRTRRRGQKFYCQNYPTLIKRCSNNFPLEMCKINCLSKTTARTWPRESFQRTQMAFRSGMSSSTPKPTPHLSLKVTTLPAKIREISWGEPILNILAPLWRRTTWELLTSLLRSSRVKTAIKTSLIPFKRAQQCRIPPKWIRYGAMRHKETTTTWCIVMRVRVESQWSINSKWNLWSYTRIKSKE